MQQDGRHKVGRAELDRARQQDGRYKFYHGTSLVRANQIAREGFIPSAGGCLGPGVYFARLDKSTKFAKDSRRHGGRSGGFVMDMNT